MSKADAITDLPRRSAWARQSSPYHDGERALQERAGARSFAERMGRQVIRNFMTDQHRAFFAELPFVVVGSLDTNDRRPWASVLVGYPGFMTSPDALHLTLDAHPVFGDPLGNNLAVGAPVAFVGAQLETRRRNRMTGKVASATNGAFTVKVDQSFGNCPQYIQARTPTFVGDPSGVGAIRPFDAETAVLSDQAVALIRRSDTFFIASASPGAGGDDPVEGVDVNHRGGKPGFVQVTKEDDRTILLSPDFVGNFAFSTFGNILRNPRAGMLFIDFATGDVLSLTGDAEVIWDSPQINRFPGAERLLRFGVSAGVFIKGGIPLRWSDPVAARQIAATGTWADLT